MGHGPYGGLYTTAAVDVCLINSSLPWYAVVEDLA